MSEELTRDIRIAALNVYLELAAGNDEDNKDIVL